jgi:hypothetical protein
MCLVRFPFDIYFLLFPLFFYHTHVSRLFLKLLENWILNKLCFSDVWYMNNGLRPLSLMGLRAMFNWLQMDNTPRSP